MNNIEILENCWLMKTNHVLDEENKKVRQAIENLIQETKELKEKFERYRKFHQRSLKRYVNGLEKQAKDFDNLLDDYICKDKIRELKENIHEILDKNGITRGYQQIIDNKFNKLLEGG